MYRFSQAVKNPKVIISSKRGDPSNSNLKYRPPLFLLKFAQTYRDLKINNWSILKIF